MPDVTVAGERCEWSIADFEHRCLVLIENEQQKPLPDNALISVLCNAVRLARELSASIGLIGSPDSIRKQMVEKVEAQADHWQSRYEKVNVVDKATENDEFRFYERAKEARAIARLLESMELVSQPNKDEKAKE
jgi:hypothetical protein